jgi:phage tail sheath gpL-like
VGITVNLPASVRRPGAFTEINFVDSNRGLLASPSRVAIVATKSAAGVLAVSTPKQVFDDLEADLEAGEGSLGALMARKVFEQGAFQAGPCPEVWLSLVAEPGAGTAHAKTITITGPATADGNLVIRIAGRTITVGVSNGDAAATVAAALEAEIDAVDATLPVTAGVAAAVVTCTHRTKGENGADVLYETVSAPAGIGVAYANFAVGAGVIDITLALDALVDQDYDFIAVENHKAADITDATAHTAVQWNEEEQRYRWVFLGETTTLSAANALAAAADDHTVIVVSCEASPSLPGEVAAATAAYVAGKTRPNANYDGGVLALYPPPRASAYTTAEVESALSSGTTPLRPNPQGDRLSIVRLVTTKTTENSAPFEALLDLATSRTAAAIARNIVARYLTGFQQEDLTDATIERVRDMVVAVARAAEDEGWIKDVDDLLDQIDAEEAASPAGRIAAACPIHVVSPLHQLVTKLTVSLGG